MGKLLIDMLSPRELEVLNLVGAGLTNNKIASRLYIESRTVERHIGNIAHKLGYNNGGGQSPRIAMALRYWQEQGIANYDPPPCPGHSLCGGKVIWCCELAGSA